MTLPYYIENKLAQLRRRQDINRRGYEGRLLVASEKLAEALRTELRTILDNDGKPFDLQVARHVYDFAIAAKDLLSVTVSSVEDAMRVVADSNGAPESLVPAGASPPPELASETFGGRVIRELLATLPKVLHKSPEPANDPQALVAAIADARLHGMHDLAAKLEQKLVGTRTLTPFEIVMREAPVGWGQALPDSYERGWVDGAMKAHDTVDEGTWDAQQRSPAYQEGFAAGRARVARESVSIAP